MLFQPISNKPALFIPQFEALVLSDLHIGIENELREYGVYADSKISQMESMILEICSEYKPKEIILLGDIKHSIPSTPFYEKKHLYEFLKRLQSYAKIHIIPGNHDGSIKTMVPDDIIIHGSDGYQKDICGFFHGHRWPNEKIMQSKYVFCGHTHPTVRLTDRLGYNSYESCWIKTPINVESVEKRYQTFNEDMIMVILPVFNPLCGGIAVNVESIVGPINHLVEEEKAEIYLLDGTSIGTLKQLRKK